MERVAEESHAGRLERVAESPAVAERAAETPAGALAERVVDAAALVTRLLQREVRRTRPAGLSLSQARSLSLLSRGDGVSLAELAEQLGLGAPAASRLVEELVRRELVVRVPSPVDRRRVSIRLLPAGVRALGEAQASARGVLVERLAALTPAEQARLSECMESLRRVLTGPASSRPVAGVAHGSAAIWVGGTPPVDVVPGASTRE